MVKDTTKSLEHIIMKCDPPTPAMPMMATGATVPGLCSHIAHSVDKEREIYLNCLKAQNQNKPEVEVNLKENLKIKDKTDQKSKRWKRLTIMKAPIIITTILQIRVEATDLIMVGAETDNFRGFVPRNRGQRPQYGQCQFQNYRYQRSAPQQNCT